MMTHGLYNIIEWGPLLLVGVSAYQLVGYLGWMGGGGVWFWDPPCFLRLLRHECAAKCGDSTDSGSSCGFGLGLVPCAQCYLHAVAYTLSRMSSWSCTCWSFIYRGVVLIHCQRFPCIACCFLWLLGAWLPYLPCYL